MGKTLSIGVLGGSGRTGLAVIAEALLRGHSVVTLVRSPEKITLRNKNLYIMKGDATHSENIAVLLKKIDVLIDTVSVPFFHKANTSLYSQVANALTTAREGGSSKQLIVMSSAGTHHGRKLPRPANRGYELFLGDIANDKEIAEEVYLQSSLPRTIIKAPLLTNGTKKSYELSDFTNYTPSLFDTISRKTIATCILDIAEEKGYIHQKVTPKQHI